MSWQQRCLRIPATSSSLVTTASHFWARQDSHHRCWQFNFNFDGALHSDRDVGGRTRHETPYLDGSKRFLSLKVSINLFGPLIYFSSVLDTSHQGSDQPSNLQRPNTDSLGSHNYPVNGKTISDNTLNSYAQGYRNWTPWSSQFPETNVLPVLSFHLALFITATIQSSGKYGIIEQAFYGLNWFHKTLTLPNPCESDTVKTIKEAAKRA